MRSGFPVVSRWYCWWIADIHTKVIIFAFFYYGIFSFHNSKLNGHPPMNDPYGVYHPCRTDGCGLAWFSREFTRSLGWKSIVLMLYQDIKRRVTRLSCLFWEMYHRNKTICYISPWSETNRNHAMLRCIYSRMWANCVFRFKKSSDYHTRDGPICYLLIVTLWLTPASRYFIVRLVYYFHNAHLYK